MKAFLFAFLALALLTGFTGCESELPDRSKPISERLMGGIRGEGKLYIPDSQPGYNPNFSSGQ